MTEEQKKAIDACKDQAAVESGYRNFPRYNNYHPEPSNSDAVITRAMQLYGEQCQSELIDLLKYLDEYFYHNDCRGAAPFMEKIESILQKAKIPTESEKDGLP